MSWGQAAATAASAAASILGGQSEWKKQKKVLQNQIQWRVADAEKAGVHPLYALGAPTMSYTPSGSDNGAGALAGMGQDLSRAKLAQMDARERRAELLAATARADREFTMKQEQHAVDLETGMLQNDLLRSQIGRANSAQLPPSPPTPTRGPNAGAVTVPSEVRASAPGDGRRQAGTITDYQYVRTGQGIGVVPSEDIAQRFDEIPGQGIGWWWRNNALPFFGRNVPRPPPADQFPLPPDYRWVWNGTEFRARRVRTDGTVDHTGLLPHR